MCVCVCVWSNSSCFIEVSVTGRVQVFQHFSMETSCVSDVIREKRGREEEKDERIRERMKEKWVHLSGGQVLLEYESVFVETSVRE